MLNPCADARLRSESYPMNGEYPRGILYEVGAVPRTMTMGIAHGN